jgi:nucleoside-diphosphate-sugar epimerase
MFDKLIIGCGDLGRRLASARLREGEKIAGVVRSSASIARLEELGITGFQVDLDEPPLPELPIEQSCLFYFAPPPRDGIQDSRVRALEAAFPVQGNPSRLVYLSTTGVYGDCQGEWVDESREPNPKVERALRRRDAEQVLQRWSSENGAELIILRVAGIYGPGKLPLARLREGLPLIRESEAPFTNRIHIDDLVQVCTAAMERGVPGQIYNVSDGEPGTMTDYFNRIADRAGLPRAPQISMAEGSEHLSAGMMSYMRESRRLDNSKMLRELGVELRYPNLELGLESCFDGV